MSMEDELRDLEEKAIAISGLKDPAKRHKGGLYLNEEIKKFDEKWQLLDARIELKEKVELMAIIQIMMDIIFRDIDLPTDIDDGLSDLDVGKLIRAK